MTDVGTARQLPSLRVWHTGDPEPEPGTRVVFGQSVWIYHPQHRWIVEAAWDSGALGIEWHRLLEAAAGELHEAAPRQGQRGQRSDTGIYYHAPAGFTFSDRQVLHHAGRYVYPGRQVVAGAWPLPPETCDDISERGIWIVADPQAPNGWRQASAEGLEGQLLVCPTCGLDST